MLEYKEVIVDKALVIEIANDLEIIVRKKKARRSVIEVLKDIFSVESLDSKDKDSAMVEIHDRISFK